MRKGEDDAYAWVLVEDNGYNIITRDWDIAEAHLLEGKDVYPLYLGKQVKRREEYE